MKEIFRQRQGKVRAAAVLLVVLLASGLIEGMARAVIVYRDSLLNSPIVAGLLKGQLDLDPYEEVAPEKGLHWRLRPGYAEDVGLVGAAKAAAGKVLGAKALRATRPGEERVLRVNQAGFRGAELDPRYACCRILMIGDSVTFGLGGLTYPRVVQDVLRDKGVDVEVVNGGVEGYAVRNVVLEEKRYLAVKPRVVTLLIGWNDLYSGSTWQAARTGNLKIVWLAKRAWWTLRGLFGDKRAVALSVYARPKSVDPNSDEVAALADFVPPALERLEVFIDRMERAGVRVVVMTLPGLFVHGRQPSRKAVSIGHLPTFTNNPFVLVRLVERFNHGLRQMARRKKLTLIDLEEWRRSALVPGEEFFLDSVHMTADGLSRLGRFVAGRLVAEGVVSQWGKLQK